jgi:general secretion pathway protein L
MVSPAKAGTPKVSFSLSAAQVAADFFSWWRTELAATIPPRLRTWWAGSDPAVLIGFDATQIVVERIAGGRRQALQTLAAGDEAGQTLASVVGSGDRVLLCLSPEKVLRRTVSVPLALEENLRQALGFELDRFTPFKPEQVYFDFRVIERDAALRRLTLDLAVVRRQEVDSLRSRALGLGLRASAAVLAEDAIHHRNPLNFLPVAASAPSRSARLWWRLGLGLLACALLATLLAVPVLQKRASAINLLRPLAEAKAAAQATDALRDRLDKMVAENNLLPDKKWGSHSALMVLEELALRLKDDTYLNHFDFDGTTVILQGESDSAADLVEILEASPLFKDVTFKSQLIKVQGTSYARFHIAAQLEEGSLPKPVSSTLTASPDFVSEPAAVAKKP